MMLKNCHCGVWEDRHPYEVQGVDGHDTWCSKRLTRLSTNPRLCSSPMTWLTFREASRLMHARRQHFHKDRERVANVTSWNCGSRRRTRTQPEDYALNDGRLEPMSCERMLGRQIRVAWISEPKWGSARRHPKLPWEVSGSTHLI
jgi:hypothetical protein